MAPHCLNHWTSHSKGLLQREAIHDTREVARREEEESSTPYADKTVRTGITSGHGVGLYRDRYICIYIERYMYTRTYCPLSRLGIDRYVYRI